MLLKDCPVGSVVRCVKWSDDDGIPDSVSGKLEVKIHPEEGKFYTSTSGINWYESDCPNDDYEIISYPKSDPEPTAHKTIYLKGKHYNLKPLRGAEVIEIDGVEYFMEERE